MRTKINTIFSSLISSLWLMSFCFGFLFLNFSQQIDNQDLVYCPLQKTWVKRNEEPESIRQNPLDQICMSDAKKQTLAIQISLKKSFAINEKGIFETLQKGLKVLDSYRETQNLPENNLAQTRHSFSVLNTKNDLKLNFPTKKDAFSFALNSRPPTVQNSTKFDFQFARKLEKISCNINPRSPPFSI